MLPLAITSPNVKAFEAVYMKLLELIVGNFFKNQHFLGFLADVNKNFCDLLINGNVTTKSTI